MYNFSYFKEKDNQAILDFIEEYPFAVMTGSIASSGEIATQIPILLEERDGELYFKGHIYDNIISKLKENGCYSDMIAKEMTKRRAALFRESVEWDGSRFDS